MLILPRSGNQSTDDGGGKQRVLGVKIQQRLILKDAPIGNASRSSTSSQRRSPHISGVLEETRKPISKQVTREISHDRTTENASSSSAAASTTTPPPYNINHQTSPEGSYMNAQ